MHATRFDLAAYFFLFQTGAMSGEHCWRMLLSLRISSVAAIASAAAELHNHIVGVVAVET